MMLLYQLRKPVNSKFPFEMAFSASQKLMILFKYHNLTDWMVWVTSIGFPEWTADFSSHISGYQAVCGARVSQDSWAYLIACYHQTDMPHSWLCTPAASPLPPSYLSDKTACCFSLLTANKNRAGRKKEIIVFCRVSKLNRLTERSHKFPNWHMAVELYEQGPFSLLWRYQLLIINLSANIHNEK